jgi:hypothetical protein
MRARSQVAEHTRWERRLGFDIERVEHEMRPAYQLSNSSLFRSRKAWQRMGIVQQSKGGDPMSSGILRTAMSRSLGFMPDLPLVAA